MTILKKSILFEPVFFGADIETIAKAKTYSVAMHRFFGVKPTMDIRDRYVRLFYTGDALKEAQQAYYTMLLPGEESDVKIDYLPIVLNPTAKRYKIPLLVASAVLALLVIR